MSGEGERAPRAGASELKSAILLLGLTLGALFIALVAGSGVVRDGALMVAIVTGAIFVTQLLRGLYSRID